MIGGGRHLRDILVSALSTPLVDASHTAALGELTPESCVDIVLKRFRTLHRLNARIRVREDSVVLLEHGFRMQIERPRQAEVTFLLVKDLEGSVFRTLLRGVSEPSSDDSAVVVLLSIDVSQEGPRKAAKAAVDMYLSEDRRGVIVEPTWLAGWLGEAIPPLALPIGQYARAEAVTGERTGGLEEVATVDVAVRRVRRQLAGIEGAVLPDPGSYSERLRLLEAYMGYDGPIYLCSTFLTPVTFVPAVVERFYRDRCGYDDALLTLVRGKVSMEWEAWQDHIRRHRRVDVIDRKVLIEYLDAPEYYQMPVTWDELREQVERLCLLLQCPNYELCLTSEAVDLSFELRGDEVCIRTDRRNKGRPREGKIAGVALSGAHIASSFENEFWSIYNRTDARFRDGAFLSRWLRDQVEARRKSASD